MFEVGNRSLKTRERERERERAVSYTHLDVYKRQHQGLPCNHTYDIMTYETKSLDYILSGDRSYRMFSDGCCPSFTKLWKILTLPNSLGKAPPRRERLCAQRTILSSWNTCVGLIRRIADTEQAKERGRCPGKKKAEFLSERASGKKSDGYSIIKDCLPSKTRCLSKKKKNLTAAHSLNSSLPSSH